MRLKSLICLVLAWALPTAAQMQINEIMQANVSSCFTDNEFPDSWVELYNSGTTNFRLAGYRLGATPNYEEAALISGGAIARAGQYVVIYADKQGPLGYHVDMRLDSGKGELYLFTPSGEIADHLSYPKTLGPNVSYSRIDHGEDWAFVKTPTPGKPNDTITINTTLPEPVFSRNGFVHCGLPVPFTLRVTAPEGVALPAGTRLHYTTDGSEPTSASPSVETQLRMSVYRTTVVRARFIAPTAASPHPTTHSYIFHPRDTQLPVVSINTDDKYFNDSEIGIFAGENYQRDWRRPIGIEYFATTDEDAVVNQMGECRVHGAYTRVNAQKSLAVYTQKRFGNKRFDYPFWEHKPEVDAVKSFVLRNGGNCFATNRIADQAGETLFGRNAANLDYMENTEVIAYVNGVYKGIYDLRERSNEDNVEANYDGLDDITMVENYDELKKGNKQLFDDFVALYNSAPTYEQMAAAVDIDNFVKSIITQAYVTNTDWPGNNMVMWRPNAADGKWRIMLKDLDFYGSNGINSTFFNHLLRANGHEGDTGEGNRPESVKVFQVLWQFPEFRQLVIDNFTVNAGDFLRKNLVREHLQQLADGIDSEYTYHLAAYGNPTSYAKWQQHVEDLISWSEMRSDFIRDNLIREYFGLGALVPLSVITHDFPVTINGVSLSQSEFIGNYYTGGTVRAVTPNHKWKYTITYGNGSVRRISVDSCVVELPMAVNIKSLELEVDESSAITDLTSDASRPAVSITAAAGNVCVECASPLRGVTVLDVAGRTIATHPGGDMVVELHLPARGIYIVAAATPQGVVARKVRY